MFRHFVLLLLAVLFSTTAGAQQFSDYFTDATLRLDYSFAGSRQHQTIALDELCK